MSLRDRSLARTPASFFWSCFQRLPFGVGGSEGRDRDRYLRAAWSIAFNAVSAAPGLTVVLLSVSFTLPYLGQERFGIWMTISSLAVILSVLDFGVVNGLVNLVASAGATEDHDRLRTIVTRGLTVLAVIGLVAATVLIAALSMLDLPWLLKLESEPVAKEAALSTLVFIALFCVNIPLGGIRKVFHGLPASLGTTYRVVDWLFLLTPTALSLCPLSRPHSVSGGRPYGVQAGRVVYDHRQYCGLHPLFWTFQEANLRARNARCELVSSSRLAHGKASRQPWAYSRQGGNRRRQKRNHRSRKARCQHLTQPGRYRRKTSGGRV
jgi:hypothetical protein